MFHHQTAIGRVSRMIGSLARYLGFRRTRRPVVMVRLPPFALRQSE